MFSLVGLGLVAIAGAAPAPTAPTPALTAAAAVMDSAVRELAFSFSQALLPPRSPGQTDELE